MANKLVLLLAMSIAGFGIASASTLQVSVSGKFSGSDVAGQLVAPNQTFNLSFDVNSNTVPLSGTVTSLSFDVPITGFVYTLGGTPVNVMPTGIAFDTLANGGLFDVTFGSGLTADQFSFEGAQAFSGTTAAPVFSPGSYAVSSLTYSDPVNFDAQTPTSLAVTISTVPEPSSIFLALGGLAGLIFVKLKGEREI